MVRWESGTGKEREGRLLFTFLSRYILRGGLKRVPLARISMREPPQTVSVPVDKLREVKE